MPRHKHKIKNTESLPGCASEPRSKQFDSTLHKSLNSELKYLYTAITRAKCNLWIYDSNKKNRTPMLHYWHRKGAVRIVAADGSDGQNYSLVFASNSTPEQWSAQGDNFRKRHLWEQAILCYEKAGMQYQYLAKEARAYHYIQEARQQKPQLFLNAALAFLERDELSHSVSCLSGAAICFKNSRPPKQIVAAKLFERLGDLAKAAQCFLRAKDFDNFARIQEQRGEYNMVIRSLQGKPFMRKREALAKADEYEKKGHTLDPKLTPSVMSFSCAKFYSERKDKKILLEVLKYMPEQERRVKFLKEAELFMEAFDDYAANKQYSHAYRLAIAQGWFDKGIELAQQDQDKLTEAKFILLQAKQEYLNKYFPVTNNIDDNDPEVSQNFVDKLKRVTLLSKDKLLQAEANLLLGMLNDTVGCCITALGQFKQQKHKAGRLEAFDQVITYGKVSDQEVLDCSHVAKKASASLRGTNDMNIDVKESVKFYGLQLIGKVYLTSPKSNIWLSREILKFKCDDTEHDIDGMLCLNYNIRNAIADRYGKFATIWPTMSKLEPRLQSKLQVFKLHSLLVSKRSLDQQYTPHEVSSAAMREYLQACVHFLELRVLKNEPTGSLVAHILAIFSPQVYTYLPQCLNAQHLQTIRISENSRKCFTNQIDKIITESPQLEELKIDEWLMFVWRASCITLPSMKGLLEKMNAMEDKINKAVKETKDYLPPPGYIYWKNDKRFCHIFSLWLNSCVDIRERSRPLWAAKLAITHFMGNIAEDRRIKISVMNGIDILSVHCTSLLAMITNANALQNISTTFTVPLLYKHMVDHFSCMNYRKGMPDKSLLAACVEQVLSYRNQDVLCRECKQLLVRAMSYLVGTHSRPLHFSLLKVGLRYPLSNATRLCLILTLTLFGNLSMLKVRELEQFEEKILSILKSAISKNDKVPAYIRNVYHQVSSNSSWLSRPGFVFNLVADLLKEAKIDNTLSKLKFDSSGHIEFSNYIQATNAPKPRIGDHPSAKLPVKTPPMSQTVTLSHPVTKTPSMSELAQPIIQPPVTMSESVQPTTQLPVTMAQPVTQPLVTMSVSAQPMTQLPVTMPKSAQPVSQPPVTMSESAQPVTRPPVTSKSAQLTTQPPVTMSESIQTPVTMSESAQLMTQPPVTMSESAHPVTQLPVTMSESAQPVTQPPVTMSESAQPVTQPPVTSKSAQLTTQPPVTMSESAQLTTQPPVTMSESAQPVTQPPVAMSESAQSMTQPPVTMSESAQPVTRPPVTMSESAQPVTRPPVTMSESAQPVTRPPVTMSESAQPVTRPPVTMSESAQPVTRPPVTMSESAQPVTRPPVTMSESAQPVTRPPVTMSESAQPVTRPPVTMSESAQPVTQPPVAMSESAQLMIQTPVTMSESAQPVTRPPVTMSESAQPVTRPPVTMSESAQPVTRPPVTMSESAQPVTRPPVTMSESAQLVTQPPVAMSESAQLMIQTPVTMSESAQPVTQPPVAMSESAQPVTQLPVTRSKSAEPVTLVASTLNPNAPSYFPEPPEYSMESSVMPTFQEEAYFPERSSSYGPPMFELGNINSQTYSPAFSFPDVGMSLSVAYAYGGTTYFFPDDSFFFSEQNDEPEGAYMEGDYGESYGLIQQSQPTIPVDPKMTEDDIIDDVNNFCNVCGISYQKDDTTETGDYDPERPNLENFYVHVTGQPHCDNTISYKSFKACTQEPVKADTGNFTLVQLAEKKLKECRDLHEKAETEQLDQVMDTLHDQIKRYHEAIADIKERRTWREGVTKVSGICEGMKHILKTATDEAHKVTAYLPQKSITEDDQELNEIEELNMNMADGYGKMRTADQKQHSRDKKRSRKKRN